MSLRQRDMAMPDNVGFSGKRWPQDRDEVREFISVLVAEGVESYLEIGCRYGDTVHAVGMALPLGARVVACDLPDAKNGRKNIGRHPESGKFLQRAVDDLAKNGRDAHCILGDSHDPEIVKAVLALGPFDAILIDGDHTPAGARADWTNFAGAGHIIALHDIYGDQSAARGPRPLFAELRKTHARSLTIGKGERRGFGLVWRA